MKLEVPPTPEPATFDEIVHAVTQWKKQMARCYPTLPEQGKRKITNALIDLFTASDLAMICHLRCRDKGGPFSICTELAAEVYNQTHQS
jgi:hypothetical protein